MIFEHRKDLDIFRGKIEHLDSFAPHLHRYIEYHYIVEGEQHCSVNGIDYVLKSGDFLLIFPYCIHSFEESTAVQYFALVELDVFSKYYSILLKKLPTTFVVSKDMLPEKINFLTDYTNSINYVGKHESMIFYKDYTEENYIEKYILYDALSCLIGEVLKRMVLYDIKDAASMPNENALTRVINYCIQNYENDISLADVAENCYLESKYVSKLFTKSIGVTFTDFINERRIAKACQMLSENKKNIINIAFECGFKNQSTFNLVFKKHMGVTPRQYRKKPEKNIGFLI